MYELNTFTRSGALVALLVGLSGCFDKSDAGEVATAASGAESCLAKAMESPCDLLSAEIVGTFAQPDVEREAQKIGGQHLCQARWEAGRTRTFEVAGTKIEAPVPDSLMLGSIAKLGENEADAARTFTARRSTPSQAKKDEMTAATQERVNGAVDEKHKELANRFAARLMNSIEFEPVEGIGDAAAWGGAGKSKQLWVRLGRYEVTMRLERSSDQNAVKQDNMDLARALVDGCS